MAITFRSLLAAVLITAFASSALARDDKAGVFDYYVLSLSWSPSYCGSPAGRSDASQCAPGRRFAFMVHGLWPQFNRGWPEYCPTAETWVPEEQIEAMLDMMPSRKLIIHEWRKHGTCSGLSQQAYFNAIRSLRGIVSIPARYLSPDAGILTTPLQLVQDFVASNKNLTAEMLSVQCGNARNTARLSELRICLDRSGNFASCGRNEANRCQAREIYMPEVR